MERKIIVLLIIGVILSIFLIGYEIGKETSNPCIERTTDCEVECSGEGTPAYECWEVCPCIKRKYN